MLSSDARRVLIVDDDPRIHRLVTRMLPGFALQSAFHGPGALAEIAAAHARGSAFALVVLDIAMPGWGGLETLERIRKLAPDIQAVFCTGSALELAELRARFGDTDAVLVLKKPCSQVELAQAVHALTTKWQLSRQVRAHVDELESTVATRSSQLAAANERLAEELAWRDRVERALRVSQRPGAVGHLAAGIMHESDDPLEYGGDHLEFVQDASAELLALVDRFEAWTGAQDLAGPLAPCGKLAIDLPSIQTELPSAFAAIRGGVQRIRAIVRAMKELSHPGTRDPD